MADQSIPLKGVAYTLSFSLYKADGSIITNPGTMARAISVDGGPVDTTPVNAVTEEDTTYGQLSWVLDAAEMNGDVIWVYCADDTVGCIPFTASIYPSAGAPASAAALAAVDDLVDDIESRLTAARAGYLDALSTGVPVASVANGAITAAAIATNAIDDDALAADAVTAVQSGLATATALATVDDFLDTEIAAIKAKTDAIGTVSVTVTSPVAESGDIELYESADYDAEDSRQVDIDIATSGVPDLTGATVTMRTRDVTWTAVSVTAVTVDAVDYWRVRFEYDSDDTAALTASQGYQLWATLAVSERAVPLVRGMIELVPAIPVVA